MAVPRVFVSSTFYDLRHVRSILASFVTSLGFETILSERGQIPYLPEQPLDESCYKEARSADIFLLIIGGRYGSERSESSTSSQDNGIPSPERSSVTKTEFDEAYSLGIPMYIAVEKAVLGEYHTFSKNRNVKVNYAHVDDQRVFNFIEHVLSKRVNNPIFPFDHPSEIEGWLRMQWAGLFRDSLITRRETARIRSVEEGIRELTEVNATLQRYLEVIVRSVASSRFDPAEIIGTENARLSDVRTENALLKSNLFMHFMRDHLVPFDVLYPILKMSSSVKAFAEKLRSCILAGSGRVRCGMLDKYVENDNPQNSFVRDLTEVFNIVHGHRFVTTVTSTTTTSTPMNDAVQEGGGTSSSSSR